MVLDGCVLNTVKNCGWYVIGGAAALYGYEDGDIDYVNDVDCNVNCM
jgi:hypothetical protein